MRWSWIVGVAVLASLAGCDRNTYEPPDPTALLTGTGSYTFADYAPLADKPVRVFYHVPDDADSDSPVVMILHGNARDAENYRDVWRAAANTHGFIIAAPEFSDALYPGSRQFLLGNVFRDSESPSPAGLVDETEWTFTLMTPLFRDFAARTDSDQQVFHAFGHSGGAQFLHRMVLLVPDGPYGHIIAANAGWYTVPDSTVAWPYGLGGTPAADAAPAWFDVALAVHAGTNDTDPGSAGLRHTPEADLQGDNRFERSQYFFDVSADQADAAEVDFIWTRDEVPGVSHDEVGMTRFAAPWLAARINED